MDHLATLAAELGALLKARGLVLALAESCTGGMAAQAVTSISGSSGWFDRGFVTYSNAAKIQMLGVSAETLKKFGAVSEQTACEMAEGALRHSQAHIACSITGIAGPDGGTADKPVGTVCFAWVSSDTPPVSATYHFDGSRQRVRIQSAATALEGLIQALGQI